MIYGDFAYVYDQLMDNVDYIKWVDFLEKLFVKYKTQPKLILELACGTGNITVEASKRGYEMIGVDISGDMLNVAKEKSLAAEQNILFLNQDMTNFELYGTVDAIVCFVDGVNYIKDRSALLRMFKLVNNYLNYDGIFIFDIRSEYGLKHILADNTFAEDNEDISYIWQNHYDSRKKASVMDVTFFVREDDVYRKFYESHTLKCYSIEEIRDLVEKAGLKFLGEFGDLRLKKPTEKDERIFFAVKKIKV